MVIPAFDFLTWFYKISGILKGNYEIPELTSLDLEPKPQAFVLSLFQTLASSLSYNASIFHFLGKCNRK